MRRIDLQQFCSKDHARYYIERPWCVGQFTYATNGHLLVKVPAEDGDAEQPSAPASVEKILNAQPDAIFAPLRVKLPAIETKACESCGGSGIWKDDPAPGLFTECEDCNGAGKIDKQTSVEIAGAFFSAAYIAQIAALPEAEFPINPVVDNGGPTGTPCPFRFAGGSGALMPMRGKGLDVHLGDLKQFEVKS